MGNKNPLSLSEHRVVIRDVELVYEVKGQGPVLLVQPGGAGWGGDRTPYVETLTPIEQGHTVVYLDPRGIGQSQRLDDPSAYAMDEYVKDIDALRQHLALEQMAILGHSHGGFVALKYAIQYPTKVERLVLVGAAPNIADDQAWMQQRPGMAEAMAVMGKLEQDTSLSSDEKHRETLLALLPGLHFHTYASVSAEFERLIRAMTVSVAPYAYFMGHDIALYDVRDALGAITAPTLIVAGDDERPTISDGSRYLANNVANVELAVMADCGHWPMLEAREAFFSAVLPFLS